ncbi:hypothetical protein E4P40_00645 [Blastococcus sp. CT_GayMR20]|uniref:tripartite tricarboxylate transporter TctB family protein n=1 Tax=Blastococcus sp. CT_GayMR20 TaxID=2559609 RepID=UPI0010742F90|nr:tripartite tricarboxylate transporter TctB family protein [Blastococcus sp. CT_GayMR20]TFV92929.1 hypothetical protein E4P40_00645 [Blastococcus sp. CT_GayMR20]
MSARRNDLVFTLTLLVLGAYALLTSLEWRFESALFPRVAGASLVAFALMQLVLGLRATGGSPPEDSVTDEESGLAGGVALPDPPLEVSAAQGARASDSPGPVEGPPREQSTTRAELLTGAALPLAFVALLLLFGFAVGGALGAVAYTYMADGRSWKRALLMGAAVYASIAVLLQSVLGVYLPSGVLDLPSF